MSQTYITPALHNLVAKKSGYRCSCCLTTEEIVGTLFTVDHITPESLGGITTPDNLFHPNTQTWQEHFAWQANGLLIVGLTPTGRATVNALKLNRPPLINARRLWIKAGWHPPQD